eukprot:gene10920-12080_t
MVRSIKRKSNENLKNGAAKKSREVESFQVISGLNLQNDSATDDIFHNVLHNCEVNLQENIVNMPEDQDQQALKHKIWVLLKTHDQYPKILDEFLEPKIISILLEKLAVLSADDGTLQPRFQGHEIDLPRLIINQFRWLDRIIEEKELVDKMLEVIPVSELPIQREIIACIPEVVQDQRHGELAAKLKEMCLHNSQLTNAVVDAFSNLNLRGNTLTEIRQSVLDILNSANLEDCPAAVRFILQSVTDADCLQVLCELRNVLNFSEDDGIHEDIFSVSRYHVACCDISYDLRCSPQSPEYQSIFFFPRKAIELVTDQSDHKVIDFYALIVMHGINTRKKAVETLFKQKIKSDVFNVDVAAKALRIHSQAFIDLHSDVLAIAESLLRSADVNLSNYGAKLYRNAFINFDTYCQQEVIGALIMHVGSGLAAEIEAAFSVLDSLVSNHPAEMAPFTVFLKSLLDYLDNLTVSQIRSLFFMLSSLIVHNANEDNIFEDDINILIRKHLSNSSIQYRKIGLIGTVMLVANMAKERDAARDTTKPSNSKKSAMPNTGGLKEVINLLKMANSCIQKDQEAACLFYDELSEIITEGSIDNCIVHWISENLLASFQDDFLVDVENLTANSNFELVFDLDEPEDGGIAVNIFPLLLEGQDNNKQGPSSSTSQTNVSRLLKLSSLFRLLATCERMQQQGSLEGIDALLGCPLVMFKMDSIERFSTLDPIGKEIICSALFFSINWTREVINAFSTQEDPETKGKILSRLQTISELCSMLEKCLAEMPNYAPPQAIFDVEELAVLKPPMINQVEKNGKKLSKKKAAPKRDNNEPKDDLSFEKDPDNDKDSVTDDKGDEKTKEKSSISLQQYLPFLREFDLSVFNALKYGVVSKNVLDSELNTKETEVLALKPSSLKLLLEDLDRKLNHALPSTSLTRKTIFKKKTNKTVGFSHLSKTSSEKIAELLIGLLPSLCDHLEIINSNFQNVLDRSDVIIDANEKDSEEFQNMGENFKYILSCIHRLFSWEKLKFHGGKPLLKKAATFLATRIKPLDDDEAEIDVILKEAFHYVMELSSTAARDLSTCVLILKILSDLQRFNGDKEQKACIASTANRFLKTDWSSSQLATGQKHNDALYFLLELRIDMSDEPVDTLETIAGCLAEFAEDKNRSADYPTLNRNSFVVYYKALLEKLTTNMKKEFSNTIEDPDNVFAIANGCVRIFYLLISIVKIVDTRAVLACSLKLGRVFLEVFLKHCMPVLDMKLKTNKDEVHGLLKNLQQSTRCLQHFCGHSKVNQDMIMTNYVPALKKCLEMFVFRVKAMLATNRCHSAFWLGNLKNRDIHGNEIQSQVSVAEDEEETGQESEQVTECDHEMAEDEGEGPNNDDISYSQSF